MINRSEPQVAEEEAQNAECKVATPRHSEKAREREGGFERCDAGDMQVAYRSRDTGEAVVDKEQDAVGGLGVPNPETILLRQRQWKGGGRQTKEGEATGGNRKYGVSK